MLKTGCVISICNVAHHTGFKLTHTPFTTHPNPFKLASVFYKKHLKKSVLVRNKQQFCGDKTGGEL